MYITRKVTPDPASLIFCTLSHPNSTHPHQPPTFPILMNFFCKNFTLKKAKIKVDSDEKRKDINEKLKHFSFFLGQLNLC